MTKKDFINNLTDELLTVKRFSKKDVLKAFENYVDNKAFLSQCVDFGLLYYDYAKYKKMFVGTLFEEGISEIITLTKQAYQISPSMTMSVLSSGYGGIVLGLAHYTQTAWSSSHFVDGLRPDVFVKTAFCRIGDMIENSLKPYLVMINELRCIITNSSSNQKKLGVIVDAIIKFNPIFKSLFSDILLNIPVSQWRNISDHGSYKYTADGVEIEYGIANECKKQLISLVDLEEILINIDNLLYMNKIARTLLGIEYHDCYSTESGRCQKNEYTLQDDIIMQIVESAYAYGLIVLDIDLNENTCIFNLEQYYGEISKADLKNFLTIVYLITNTACYFYIYRKGKVEYTADLKNGKLKVMKYIVK